MKSHVPIRKEGATAVVEMPKLLDESFDTSSNLKALRGSIAIIFDFDKVERITSYGIRQWIDLLDGIDAKTYYCFVRCPPNVVAQITFVVGFSGRADILSIYLPYVCPSCDERSQLLIDLTYEHERIEQFAPPALRCSRCGVDSDFDEVPSSYFSFLATAPRPAPPSEVSSLVPSARTRPEHILRIAKEKKGLNTLIKLGGAVHDGASFDGLAEDVGPEVTIDLGGVSEVEPIGADRFIAFVSNLRSSIRLVHAPPAILDRLAESAEGRQIIFAAISGAISCPRCRDAVAVELAPPKGGARPALPSCCRAEIPGAVILAKQIRTNVRG
jgi:hypothetical protein